MCGVCRSKFTGLVYRQRMVLVSDVLQDPNMNEWMQEMLGKGNFESGKSRIFLAEANNGIVKGGRTNTIHSRGGSTTWQTIKFRIKLLSGIISSENTLRHPNRF